MPAAAPGPQEASAVPLGERLNPPATSRHEAGKKAWETMKAMADANLDNLIAGSGLIRPPLESVERDHNCRRSPHGRPLIEEVDGRVYSIDQNGKVVFAGKP